jgi:hypothetical protein
VLYSKASRAGSGRSEGTKGCWVHGQGRIGKDRKGRLWGVDYWKDMGGFRWSDLEDH